MVLVEKVEELFERAAGVIIPEIEWLAGGVGNNLQRFEAREHRRL